MKEHRGAESDTAGKDASGGEGAHGPGKRTLTEGMEEGAGSVRVTASALRVRTAPSTSTKVVGRLPRGSLVATLGKEGAWYQIEHHGHKRFIHGGYTENVGPAKDPPPAPEPAEDDGPALAPPVNGAPEPAVANAPPPTENAAPPPPAPEPAQATPEAPIPDAAPQAPGPAQAPPKPDSPAPAGGPVAAQPTLGGTYKGMFSKVYDTGHQKVQVFVSPGGISSTPDIYLHFHGHYADYGIDPDAEWDDKSGPKDPKERPKPVKSGIDQAREAMQHANGKNTIAMMPQGVIGQGSQSGGLAHEGGFQEDLDKLGLPGFLAKILSPLAKDLGITGELAPGNIGIGGHSAGGYTGSHTALSKAGVLADAITDITFFDASYTPAHLEDAKKWMVKGKPGKNLRIVNSWYQQSEKSKGKKYRDNWFNRFGPAALEALAAKEGMSVKHLETGEKFDADTKVMQHSQLIKGGAVQCDILVSMLSLKSGNDHEPLRDRYIDDAMLSVGEGVQGNEEFGHYDKGQLDPAHAHGADHAEAPLPQPEPQQQLPRENEAADPKIHTLPQAEHLEDNGKAPEPVKPPPKAEAPKPEAKAPAEPAKGGKKGKNYVEGNYEQLKLGLYGTDGKGGLISKDKLHRDWTLTPKGKKEKQTFSLTDAQWEFKQKCFDAAIKRLGKKLYGGVADDDLASCGHNERVRKEVVAPLKGMIQAMKSDLGPRYDCWVSSGYRDPVEDFSIWDNKFNETYLWDTQKYREAKWPENPYCDEAVEYQVTQIAPRKAPPGGSNHSNGIAVDLAISVDGEKIGVSFSNQKAYRATPQYEWLMAHAQEHGFKNWYKEAWHYDYKP